MKKVLFLAALLACTTLPVTGAEKKDLSIRWYEFALLIDRETMAVDDWGDGNSKEEKIPEASQIAILKEGLYLVGMESLAKSRGMPNQNKKDEFHSTYSWSLLVLINYVYPYYAKVVAQKLIPGISANEHSFEGFAKTHMALLLPFVKSMEMGTFEIASDAQFDPALKLWVDIESQYFIKLVSGSTPNSKLSGYQRSEYLMQVGESFSSRLHK